ncbi:tripartite tricarboxylate transporter TctB family protein [Caldibacillus thermolactis]|mgnify:CR=1 FL=1|uniref:Tripartite tricarboxylate transporter TctB family protein n=1 Tax=Pallidibacillus thermolactis TaxID=251051 RepID=A0ABT2WE81_9BACI|nr:tripartite tricarboxylate transporter TctB family protein [Pallidibacillus thermolactis]MCU9593236.1 tripartite tricarboxylate transporter TctB family protein [Pallidibacillus thermolactis]MCU9599975.1 tripartite tricarboxylate transporter TctB family protein [Pallidibacillus thermolactis subsp. kokeshiiformis]MED1672936.1 tripartite tricarboxylate transporter TctB family protein [Pallidibacillus thermolactis subsp. kokeshiiformis]
MGRLIVPSVCILISIFYFIYTINLPKAKLGDPNAPMYFPLIISIFLFIMSVIYFIKELLKHYPKKEEVKLLFKGRAPVLIISTLIISLIYAFIFERIGYLASTILYMLAILFIVNGRNKWLVNLSVAVLFSVGSWYVFYHLLDVSLP